MQVMQASFGMSISSLYKQQLALSVAEPADGCTVLANPADVAGTVVLVLRGACFFAVKVGMHYAFFRRLAVDCCVHAADIVLDCSRVTNV